MAIVVFFKFQTWFIVLFQKNKIFQRVGLSRWKIEPPPDIDAIWDEWKRASKGGRMNGDYGSINGKSR